jgi:hypothetical protein
MACRLAICPTSRSPFSVKPTMDGVVRLPSLLGTTTGSPLSITGDAAVGRSEVDSDDLRHGL